ncbi:ribonuclease J [Celeribacter halophilus]|jgi:ribonuclease J|uniref:Ribonuclease J n=1 Tax=Celeribacter halophilus TaxID=576117 RepID=A0A1I3N5I0_9RHOB|nr:ribonuclease J [Celeribacter halophilus]MDO6458104.1 ribonuclease J [Celeribacter halophilus]MDO6724641.1 ribonuclease J [Celeribacter halophilus]PZX15664.1 ribonuclease J [Celeribacter halophilus]SFJ04604.1 ribonuclease J [Celeribacter halophilus]
MSDRLLYLPLGGAGEIGMNCYVYGYGPAGNERYIVVDLGVTFPSMDGTPGVDLIFADVAWLEERKDRIDGIFITHAHEDHVGAVGHLWPRLQAPIYARAFTAHLARLKFEEHGHDELQIKTVSAWPEQIKVGPFTVGFVPISHSIPESSALVIDSPAGRVIHSGDFKTDENPVVGEPFDRALFEDIAKDGVKALVCDSTNVFSPNPGRSEADVIEPLSNLIASLDGMVAATTFASNIARVKTLADAGSKAGRSVVLLGRAMRRMITAAIETGIISDFPKTVSPENAGDIPRENLMLLTTGSQGEHRAATAQLSRGKYLGLKMTEGDTLIFSSKTIPGNEVSVGRILNAFSEMGVETISGRDDIHVSGHANRPDLAMMHEIVKPQVVVPMHGEHRHLREHAKLAESNGFKAIVAPNGVGVDLSAATPRVVEYVETGRTYLDGKIQIGAMDGIVRDRIRMALNGLVVATVIVEDDEPLGDCWCELRGLPETGLSRAPLNEVLEEDVNQFLMRAKPKTLGDDDKLEEEMRRIIRRTTQEEVGKKPEVQIIISRLSS